MLRHLRVENLVLIEQAELAFASGLNAITGETGAGKTILAQAIGLLLGGRADARLVRPGATEAYVEAELDLPAGALEDDGLEALAELRPDGEDGIVLARRVFPDGRTRGYAWGRAVARDDLAAVGERLIAMSGQFEQRRLARPSYQLDVLDSFVGDEQLRRRRELREAWRELQAAKRRHDDALRGAAASAERIGALVALRDDAEGIEPGVEHELLAERKRLRHLEELTLGAGGAAEALAPEDGAGAVALAAAAERALAPLVSFAPELEHCAEELRDAGVRLREAASDLRSFLASLEGEPGRLERVESELERLAELRRRFGCATTEGLVARAAEASAELAALESGTDPVEETARCLATAEARVASLADELRAARHAVAAPFAEAVSAELRTVGMGEGGFRVALGEREPSAAGCDDVAFLVRPNSGLPFAPVAETASGGELSRIALAIVAAAVAGGDADGRPRSVEHSLGTKTLIFDEIDAGIGGRTANGVGQALRTLGQRAQVVTITHLPQIASLAERHFRVEKLHGDPTRTTIEPLAEVDRRIELERMLGGKEFLAQVR